MTQLINAFSLFIVRSIHMLVAQRYPDKPCEQSVRVSSLSLSSLRPPLEIHDLRLLITKTLKCKNQIITKIDVLANPVIVLVDNGSEIKWLNLYVVYEDVKSNIIIKSLTIKRWTKLYQVNANPHSPHPPQKRRQILLYKN